MREFLNFTDNKFAFALGNDTNIVIHKYLDLITFGNLVSLMSNIDFVDGEYLPQNGKIAYAIKVVEAYVPGLEIPEDIEEAYLLINELGIYDAVINHVSDTEQYQDLCDAIREAQEFEKTKRTGLNGLLSTLETAIKDFNFEEVVAMLRDFDPAQLENLAELRELADVFKNPRKHKPDGEGDMPVTL